jgi:DNA-binding transcriptional MerR regulator
VASEDRPVYSIGAVARMLEIPTSTLRAWEDRYQLITPGRSEGAQRLYSRKQVEQLRHIKAQIESGMSAADAHRLLAADLTEGHVPMATGDVESRDRPLILIAERDPYAADVAEYFLRTEGWEVVVALDATQASLHFAERSPDVVVLDLLLSGGAGYRLLTEFVARQKTQVVAVSAIDSAQEAAHLGAAAFLIKPLEPLAIVSTVRDLLGTSDLVRKARADRVSR